MLSLIREVLPLDSREIREILLHKQEEILKELDAIAEESQRIRNRLRIVQRQLENLDSD
jgi:hypothetical protein